MYSCCRITADVFLQRACRHFEPLFLSLDHRGKRGRIQQSRVRLLGFAGRGGGIRPSVVRCVEVRESVVLEVG